jgi:hypothetical protein
MSYGNFLFPNLRTTQLGAGVRTEFGTLLPPGARVAAYVRSTGVQSGDDSDIANRLLLTLNAGLAQCRSGFGDVIVVLPGHVESITAANFFSSLVAGTRILGMGYGTNRPTFTWTAATSTFLFNVANTVLDNCILEMAGPPASTTALSVAAPITISAAGCQISNCLIRTSVDGDQLATIPITTTDAADDLVLTNLLMYGATAGESTTMIDVLGCDRMLMNNCFLSGATSSTTVGVMRLNATAATHIQVHNSTFMNRKAASIHAVTGVASSTGVVADCNFGILDDATLVGWQTKGSLQFFRCQTVNLAGETGAATTVVST